MERDYFSSPEWQEAEEVLRATTKDEDQKAFGERIFDSMNLSSERPAPATVVSLVLLAIGDSYRSYEDIPEYMIKKTVIDHITSGKASPALLTDARRYGYID